MFILLSFLAIFQLNASNMSTRAFFSNFLYSEKAPASSHLNFEGFIGNTSKFIPKTSSSCEIKEVEKLLGKLHNMMLDTFYSCATDSPKAMTFTDSVDGKHTPDSQHYASLMHSALSLKGIKTDFFKTPTHYGIHYEDENTGEELYWCIVTPLSKKAPARTKQDYVNVFNKYKNPDINGKTNIKEADVTLISVDEFTDMLL